MKSPLKYIISMSILLLSWAFFVSPATSSMAPPSHEQHQKYADISSCDGKSCAMHSLSTQSCAEHCESLPFITTHLPKNEIATNTSFPPVFDSAQIFDHYLHVELKPPIQL